jgi:hypothetical protein
MICADDVKRPTVLAVSYGAGGGPDARRRRSGSGTDGVCRPGVGRGGHASGLHAGQLLQRMLDVMGEVLRQLGAIDRPKDLHDMRTKARLSADAFKNAYGKSRKARVGEPVCHRFDRRCSVLGDRVAKIDPILGIRVAS